MPGESINFGLLVFGVFFLTNFLNFLFVFGPRCLKKGESFMAAIRAMFVPLLPSSALAAALAVLIALTYDAIGLGALAALVIVLLLFQVLTGELLLSQRRAEELEARTEQLGSLQVGVLATLIQTLALRDKMTARHSAAVARYAKSIAEELGLRRRRSRTSPTPPACCTTSASSSSPTASCSPTASSPTTTGRSSRSTRPRARASSAASTATARSPTSSSPTTSASTARATRTTCRPRRSR